MSHDFPWEKTEKTQELWQSKTVFFSFFLEELWNNLWKNRGGSQVNLCPRVVQRVLNLCPRGRLKATLGIHMATPSACPQIVQTYLVLALPCSCASSMLQNAGTWVIRALRDVSESASFIARKGVAWMHGLPGSSTPLHLLSTWTPCPRVQNTPPLHLRSTRVHHSQLPTRDPGLLTSVSTIPTLVQSTKSTTPPWPPVAAAPVVCLPRGQVTCS